MTAVFLAHTAAPSGAELATLRLVSALPAGTAAVVYTEDGPMPHHMRERGIETRSVTTDFDSRALTIDKADTRALFAGALGLIRLGWRLGDTMRELGATVVVAGSTKALLMGAVAARRARVPLVWHVHDRVSADYFGRWLAPALRILGWLVAHGVIANSRGTLASLYTWRRPAVVAYPGVEFRHDHAEPNREEQRDPAETVVAVVGRLAPWKGQDVFLRALADVRVLPREVFLIGGTFFDEEHYRTELENLATALDLPVTFTGHVDDPEPYLRCADVLVHCSVLPEPFGQVVVEGMRAGCAVIASRPGGPEEIIETGRDGLLVPGGDRHQLTRALDTLLGDRELRVKLAAAARLRAHDFDIDESARTVERFLTTVTVRRRKWWRRG
ncbi:glycosyltransferase family 4 protein [Nocardia otitidiscaviarum]|uniref:glycosyltransferase family 4 protein n=1 Tax=Nocardia otitidiscaviarum TaxID=1823 RepID=UPI0024554AC5|nr:glycosyltransferase family 4 protein [Nocardia otitidiscaviarum]